MTFGIITFWLVFLKMLVSDWTMTLISSHMGKCFLLFVFLLFFILSKPSAASKALPAPSEALLALLEALSTSTKALSAPSRSEALSAQQPSQLFLIPFQFPPSQGPTNLVQDPTRSLRAASEASFDALFPSILKVVHHLSNIRFHFHETSGVVGTADHVPLLLLYCYTRRSDDERGCNFVYSVYLVYLVNWVFLRMQYCLSNLSSLSSQYSLSLRMQYCLSSLFSLYFTFVL